MLLAMQPAQHGQLEVEPSPRGGQIPHMITRRRITLARAIAVIVLVAACSPPISTAPAPPGVPASTVASDPEISAIKAHYYDAAHKEGTLVVYGVGNAELYTSQRGI
jgi:hypothetical protein